MVPRAAALDVPYPLFGPVETGRLVDGGALLRTELQVTAVVVGRPVVAAAFRMVVRRVVGMCSSSSKHHMDDPPSEALTRSRRGAGRENRVPIRGGTARLLILRGRSDNPDVLLHDVVHLVRGPRRGLRVVEAEVSTWAPVVGSLKGLLYDGVRLRRHDAQRVWYKVGQTTAPRGG